MGLHEDILSSAFRSRHIYGRAGDVEDDRQQHSAQKCEKGKPTLHGRFLEQLVQFALIVSESQNRR